ncbi:DUF4374 domain-containing protein [Salegentibacter sp. JZCK2]|uniref:DUF4374 domain-containing protein n=1 Tax=Salegentibacter tibetensis TaxID=2873600 RepID=UPI001CCA0E3D|nr:DUF4374 domain-containing protein [Salegentibacter tibetensis]MBZ9729941.1 DUF4374 domain-containing protein [Salegentibacter tibetensis]
MTAIKKLVWLSCFGILFTACEKDDNVNPNPEPEPESSQITMAFKTTGGEEPEYIITEENIMEGSISAQGTGIEQTGWRFYYPVGNTLFASGYSEDNRATAYTSDEEGIISAKGQFTFDNALEMFGQSNDNETLLAFEIPRSGYAPRKLYFVDVDDVQVEKIVETSIFESQEDELVAWPSAIQVRGNNLFVPFHKMDPQGYFTTPSVDTAFVAIYSYPNVEEEPIKIISDTRTSNIGVNGATTGLIENEQGDIYSFSSGATMAGFSPASTKPSGILRIPNGETDFDEDYFFNVEEATGGEKLFWFDYVGNNKAIARLLTHDDGAAWGAFGRDAFNQKLVILDLEAQTVTEVADVHLHAKRYSSPVFVEDGKIYVSIETANEAYVYQVDIETAKATKGAKIEGKTIKGFYKL